MTATQVNPVSGQRLSDVYDLGFLVRRSDTIGYGARVPVIGGINLFGSGSMESSTSGQTVSMRPAHMPGSDNPRAALTIGNQPRFSYRNTFSNGIFVNINEVSGPCRPVENPTFAID